LGKNNSDRIRSIISLSLLTIGTIIIVLGAIRGFGYPVFELLFRNPLLEEQAGAVIGLGTAFTFIAIWLQQRPFARLRKGLGL
jgi:predicted lysophospholipase L1 biosynthesis ABC-type transport system permease subunit